MNQLERMTKRLEKWRARDQRKPVQKPALFRGLPIFKMTPAERRVVLKTTTKQSDLEKFIASLYSHD